MHDSAYNCILSVVGRCALHPQRDHILSCGARRMQAEGAGAEGKAARKTQEVFIGAIVRRMAVRACVMTVYGGINNCW